MSERRLSRSSYFGPTDQHSRNFPFRFRCFFQFRSVSSRKKRKFKAFTWISIRSGTMCIPVYSPRVGLAQSYHTRHFTTHESPPHHSPSRSRSAMHFCGALRRGGSVRTTRGGTVVLLWVHGGPSSGMGCLQDGHWPCWMICSLEKLRFCIEAVFLKLTTCCMNLLTPTKSCTSAESAEPER